MGVEPPKFHDVGPILVEHRSRLPAEVSAHLDRLREISRRLRKEGEFAFCGDMDFIPREQYSQQDAMTAASDARFVVAVANAARATLAGTRDGAEVRPRPGSARSHVKPAAQLALCLTVRVLPADGSRAAWWERR